MNTIQNEFEILVRSQSTNLNSHSFLTADANIQRRHSMGTSQSIQNQTINNTVIKSKSTSIYSLHQTSPKLDDKNDESINQFSHRHRPSLLPNDPGLNGAGNSSTIQRQNSNESDESDTLSKYFDSSQSRNSSLVTTGDQQNSIQNETSNATRRLQNFIKSDERSSRGSTSIERKPSISLGSFKFLKKRNKSVDLTNQPNTIINQLRENDYVGDIELQIGHDSEREQLVVRIIRAKNLIPKDTNGFSDPFVKVYLLPGRE
jgi:hypothetical protein